MASRKYRKGVQRRDRRKAKQSGWKRHNKTNMKKVGHS